MGSSKHGFKKDDDDDDDGYDDVQNEFSDENGIIMTESIDVEDESLELNSDDTNSDSDDDSDFVLESNEEETNSDIDKESVESLSVGREKKDFEDDILKLVKSCNSLSEQQPPTILADFTVSCVSFSPSNDILAVGSIEGDISL